ncbi:hypothetical protein ACP70R_001972 [Stipagrostis hirtigluma subsp. patula]
MICSNQERAPKMETMEELTALSLGIGSSRGNGCKAKQPGQFDDLLPDQLQGEIDQGGNGNHARKKLRLTPEQLTVLESVYNEQQIPDPDQKQGLARNLDLKPRQVEVWFQNRRARSKQTKTAADCEKLRRWVEVLIKENQKLKSKLQELTRVPQPDLKLFDSAHSASGLVGTCSMCNKGFTDRQNHKNQQST